MRSIPFIYRTAALFFAAFLLCSGCGRKAAAETEAESQLRAAESETYAETAAVRGVNEDGSRYFGIMHAVILDVQTDRSGDRTYSLKDKSDPEEAWSVTEAELAYMEAEPAPDAEVALLFHGDIIGDSENVRFLAMLPEGSYTVRSATGVTESNMMSSFSMRTGKGELLSFVKDNCRMEEGAMTETDGDRITVYYAEGASNYPFKVYKAEK